MQNNPTIIISRTDSIGDVVLTLPLAGILKKKFPTCRIIFLGRDYTRDVIRLSEHVDEIMSYDDLLKLDLGKQLRRFQELNATHILHVFPVKEIAFLARRAKIQNRIGTTNRVWHWFTCNRFVKLSRKNSDLHEAQLNTKLLKAMQITEDFSLTDLTGFYGLKRTPALDARYNTLIDQTKTRIILHPKSKGSAREWGLANYSDLIKELDTNTYQIFISGTAAEGELIQPLISQHPHIVNLTGTLSLQQFIAFINCCDVMVAASTGPLHIAAALGKKAIGIFAPMRPIHPGRWKPIGVNAHYLVQEKDCGDCRKSMDCHCIREIKAAAVKKIIEKDECS
ncbi:MAG: glycosyltransferase family 9 protein [Bacteroidota bacterium]|nr:glycosyltransferase family 9 protein [Bacteroidota bacterium]